MRKLALVEIVTADPREPRNGNRCICTKGRATDEHGINAAAPEVLTRNKLTVLRFLPILSQVLGSWGNLVLSPHPLVQRPSPSVTATERQGGKHTNGFRTKGSGRPGGPFKPKTL
ncbi:hypothetical protein NOR_06125 [Metarhizium rileyi]|uniref:Uncharacterized protein n=1 Tax=Metarhizium rileyi (strain RCEF 4871) TaxID=1649241 RepID=A0A167B6J7_METRR|nr:hypothetical protein NOR_06125 [Metarhizium rileyi RCEF 4871]